MSLHLPAVFSAFILTGKYYDVAILIRRTLTQLVLAMNTLTFLDEMFRLFLSYSISTLARSSHSMSLVTFRSIYQSISYKAVLNCNQSSAHTTSFCAFHPICYTQKLC